MRANKPPRRKRPVAYAPPQYGAARKAVNRWKTRFLLGTVIFGVGTITAILLLMHYAPRMPVERIRMALYSAFALFIACELCAAGALVTWWYGRKRR